MIETVLLTLNNTIMDITFLGTLELPIFWVIYLTTGLTVTIFQYSNVTESQLPGCMGLLTSTLAVYFVGFGTIIWLIMVGIKISWLLVLYMPFWYILFNIIALFSLKPIITRIIPLRLGLIIRNIIMCIGIIMAFKMLP